jgi:putative methyltransferase
MVDMQTSKRRLYFLELSDVFDHQVYLPYSSGVVAAYVLENPTVRDNYDLAGWFYYRQDAHEIVDKIVDPDVVGFSCFIWNWRLNLEIAKAVKARYPKCLVVFGGQQQPLADRVGNFFKEHPYVDVLVHGEGEETLTELLLDRLKDNPNPTAIAGTSTPRTLTSRSRPRLQNIDINPSPYLNGLFDKILLERPAGMEFSAIVESARGCPYTCSFCEIGEKYYTKVRKNYSKMKAELGWLSKNKIEYITDANSNFGMYLGSDLELANYVKQKKEETGYPRAYRVTWAKGQADNVLDIARVFEAAGVQKGVTIALQSMNPDVLKAISRKNIDGGKLKEFIDLYEKNNISSYVELIWGLPEETLDSFVNGMCEIMELGYHNYLDIHLMSPLINTEFSQRDFIEKYQIKTTKTQPFFHHRHIDGTLSEDTSEFVTSTRTFTEEEWISGHQARWIVMSGHYLGPTQFISRYLRNAHGVSYKTFYMTLLQHIAQTPDSFLGQQYKNTLDSLRKILKNERHWGVQIPELSTINWSFEEATAINVSSRYDEFENDIRLFLREKLSSISTDEADDILRYQKNRLSRPGKKTTTESFKFNIHGVVEMGELPSQTPEVVEFSGTRETDVYEWARHTLWFGRRTGDYKTPARRVTT